MALQKQHELSAAVRLGLLAMAVVLLAGCHKQQGGAPAEASFAVSFAKEFASTNGVENPELIKARFASGRWLVSLRSATGAIAVVEVSPDAQLISYHFHE